MCLLSKLELEEDIKFNLSSSLLYLPYILVYSSSLEGPNFWANEDCRVEEAG